MFGRVFVCQSLSLYFVFGVNTFRAAFHLVIRKAELLIELFTCLSVVILLFGKMLLVQHNQKLPFLGSGS